MNLSQWPYFLMLFPCITYSQFQISGKAVDINGRGIEFANVVIKSENIDTLKGSITDQQGYFHVKDIVPGTYSVTISFIGYEDWNKSIKVNENIDLGEIILKEATTGLEEVVVEGKKPLIERKIDRLVFNVEQAPALQGLDLAEALANTPMIEAKDGSISIVGKSGVGIMINDRLLNISGNDLIAYLKTIRVDNISRIEIITTPPAKYDAQGNSGLINIILKKNLNDGWSGNMTGTYIQRTFGSFSGNGALNFQYDKLSLSTQFQYYDAAMRVTENYDIISSSSSILKGDKRKDFNNGVMGGINLNYRINDKSDIGFLYNVTSGDANMDIISSSNFKSFNDLDSTLMTNSKHRNALNYHTANVYYDLKLDTLGKKISLTGNLLSNNSKNPVDFETQNISTSNFYTVRNTSDVNYSILSGQGDFYLPFKDNLVLETGLKFTNIRNKSDVKYLNKVGEEFVIDPLRSNLFKYNEQNYAAYVSGAKDLGKSWSIKGGLRYEYTNVNGKSPSDQKDVKLHYSQIFPTLYVVYNIKDGTNISLNYARRIGRPSFSQLNPFRWYSNPYTYSTGNPVLQPSISNNLELSYLLNNDLSATIYYQNVSDGYGRVTELDETTTISTFLNYLTENNTGINVYYNFDKINWLQSIFFVDYKYTKATSTLPQFVGLKGTSFSYHTNNTFFLNDTKTFMLLVNYSHYLPSKNGDKEWSNRANFTMGIKASLWEKKIQVSLIGGDIFRQSISKGTSYLRDNRQYFNNYYDARRVTLNITYNFGSEKVKAINKDTKFDEKSRAN